VVLAACLAGLPAGAARAELNADETAMLVWIDTQTAAIEALIEDLVNVNSGTMNHDGVRQVGEMLGPLFSRVGFDVEWIELPLEVDRAGHLFARHAGDRGRKVLLIGHLDTVFERDDPFQTFVREGTWARGPGVDDMKSGNTIILYALMAMAEVGAIEGAQIVVALTGDEESAGDPLEVSRRDLIEAGRWADVALEFESGIRDGEAEWATVSRRSSSGWTLEVRGRQAHSSQIFTDDVGAGAIFEAARILAAFYDEIRGEPYLSFNAGTILGGTEVAYDAAATRGQAFGKTNVVPSYAIVDGGIRTLSDEQLERVRGAMRDVVARSLPQTEAMVTFEDGYPAMPPTDGNRRLQQMLSDINVELGREPMPELDPSRRGAADISFVAPHADSLAGLGGYGEGSHSPQERLDLESVPLAVKRAALLIYRLTR
jgi:glutamate carboxypeptidase